MMVIQGLTQSEVAERRARGLGNNVEFRSSRSYAQILRENAFTFINIVLFAIGAVLVIMGSLDNAVITAGLVLLNVLVGVVQEGRAKRKLDQIALLTRPRATVIRDCQEQDVDPAEIVQGDILLARPGDQIVVDGRVMDGNQFAVDESLLTGESDRIAKASGDPVYSGSFCVTGSAAYEAVKVGRDSLANRLTAQARTFRRTKTPLQRDIDYVIRIMVLLAAVLGLLLALSAVIKQLPMLQWVEIAAVIVVLVPQGLFFMTTVTYAAGAVRMAGKGALVQQANAIESMSNVDVLCLDKTGTLTANRILLEAIHPLQDELIGESLRTLLGQYAASLSVRNRTAQAIADACPALPQPVSHEVPFSSEWKWSALHFPKSGEEITGSSSESAATGTFVLAAPEVLLPCLAEGEVAITGLAETITAEARRGRRVVLFAQAADQASVVMTEYGLPVASRGALHAQPSPNSLPPGAPTGPAIDRPVAPMLPPILTPVALLSFSDELRPEAAATLRGFQESGITVKIISGDSTETVTALALQAGFPAGVRSVSGSDLGEMSESALAVAAEEAQIFGRITPQQKETLVASLRAGGHYVAMIGDGVNDVLSLKQAQLGIAMNAGSQAARGVADMVLLDNSFAALPAAFREGQRILRGMQDIIRLFLARTLYVTLLIIAAAIVGTSFPLTPKHNAVLALLTVGIPTLFLAAWAQPGRPTYWGRGRPSILRSVRHFVLPAAVTVAALALVTYIGYLLAGRSLPIARSAMTTAMILSGILLIVFVEPPTRALAAGDEFSGDWRPTKLAGVMLLLYGAIALLPGPRHFFALAPLPVVDIAMLAASVMVWAVVLLLIWRHNLFERLLQS